MLKRSDWVLLFLGAESGPQECDQLRVMKGLFLLSQEPASPLYGQYQFEAYDYGPVDAAVYRDLDALQLAGLIHVQRSLGSTRKTYDLTDSGRLRVSELRKFVPRNQLEEIERVKRRVTSFDFDNLLRQIYSEYPDFARNSVASIAGRAV